MATAKSATTKKKPATKATTAKKTAVKAAPKKPVAKKAPAKKAPVAKKTAPAKASSESVRSFKLSRESENFISSRITRQTVYWAILAIFILVVGVYVINIQLEILDTLDQLSRGA